MTGPTPIASDFQSSGGNNSNTLTSSAATIAPANGDVIVVKADTWANTIAMSAPTGGGQTFKPAQIAAPGVFAGWSGVWVCTVTGNPGSFSIISTPGSACRHSMVVERWGNAFVDATPAVFATTQATAATMSTTITTTAPNSVVSWSMSELNSRDPAGRTYTPVGTTEDGFDDGHLGSNSVQYYAYTAPIAAAGMTTVGITVPAGTLNWTASGVEIKAQAGPVIVDVAANLTASGALAAGLTQETYLAAGLTATGGMSATLAPVTHFLSANLTASSGMAAVFSLPTIGPTDPIGSPVAEKLMACFIQQLSTLPSPPRYVQLRVGSETGPLIGTNVDECCAGLAWIRVDQVYPSWDNFPGPDNTWVPCGPLAYAVVLEMGISFCMPWSTSDDSFDNVDPPSTADWQTAFDTQMIHQTLMRRTAACCFPATQRRAVGTWTALPVEAGCTGGKLTLTVSVMAPCGDC